jgi:monoamine oxidase
MTADPSPTPPAEATVVVVGAGLSGLVAATELRAAGVGDVVVLEARDRVGGRLNSFVRPNGQVLQTGGEFTGAGNVELHALAATLGLKTVSSFEGVDLENMGQFIRTAEGERILEPFPMAADPEGLEAVTAANEQIDELARQVPPAEPWNAPRAAEWDAITFGQWLDANVPVASAREKIINDHAAHGDADTTSFLYILWHYSRFGGVEAAHDLNERIVGGPAQIPQRLAEALDGQVFLSTPVRGIDRRDDGVTVRYDGGSIVAGAVISTLEPGQAGRLEFDPPLPPQRERLQSRWTAGHGGKYFVVYDKPFWREDGLAGVVMGPAPFGIIADASPVDGDEGILLVLMFVTSTSSEAFDEVLGDEDATRAAILDRLVSNFGEQAAEPKEYYAFDWTGDNWSRGCGTQLPTGVLSKLGPALRRPVGRILWAGADSGDRDWMDGAVTAGQRAAREAAALVS